MKQGSLAVSNTFFSLIFISTLSNSASSLNYFDHTYIGGNIGSAWNTSHYKTAPNCRDTPFSVFCTAGSASANNGSVVAASGTGSFSSNFFSGGAQIGHNFRVNSVVIGGEADFESFNSHNQAQETGSFPTPFLGNQYGLSQSISTKWLATVRGRIGITPKPGILFFMTGGAAFTSIKIGSSYYDNAIGFGFPGGTGSNSQEKRQTGWAAGAGAEWYIANHLSVKLEYLHADFGSNTIPIPLSNTSAYTQTMQFKADLSTNIARVGLNYQFA